MDDLQVVMFLVFSHTRSLERKRGAGSRFSFVNLVPVMEMEVHRQRRRGRCKERMRKRELSDYTSQGREKIRKNNFRVSLPRCRAVRSWG